MPSGGEDLLFDFHLYEVLEKAKGTPKELKQLKSRPAVARALKLGDLL